MNINVPVLILINPYLHDFAAYNLWNAPMGLYRVAEFLSRYNTELKLIDCTDAPVKQKADGRSHIQKERIEKPAVFKNIPRHYYRFGISRDEFKRRIKESLPAEAFLVTSVMTYWYGGVKETIDILREVAPKTPIILGGIYATLYPDHAKKTSGADVIYKGPVTNSVILSLSLPKTKNLNSKLDPSDSLLRMTRWGEKHWSDIFGWNKNYAPILTGLGCPYKCTYCATHILNSSFTRRPPKEVANEILLLAEKGVSHFSFLDDALLFEPEKHIIPILEATGPRNFYTPVGLHARFISEELARILYKNGFKYLRLGYETSVTKRQIDTGGKIEDTHLATAVKNLKKAGFAGGDIGVFIMYGLPNQPLSEVEDAVKFVSSLKVRIALTEFSPVFGTKEAERAGLTAEADPVICNNTAYSVLFGSYDKKELQGLHLKVKDHNEQI